jgi:periplasmic protein TonB
MTNFHRDTLWKALAVSLAAHGLLLAATWPASRGAGGVSTPIVATLRTPSIQALPPESPQRSVHPTPPLLASEAPVTAVPPPSKPDLDVSTVENVRRSEMAGRSPAPAAGSAAVPAGPGLDPDGLRSYRIALATRFRKFYPPRAVEAGWVGTAEVLVTVAADGSIPQVQVVNSSGHDALDNAALDMLRRAAPTTPLPETLRGRAFAVNLPVKFELVD